MSFRKKSRAFKKTTDSADARRRREQYTVQLRESTKGQEISKRRQTTSQNETAVSLLDMMSMEPEEVVRRTLEALPALVAGLNGNDPQAQLDCCREFRKLLSLEREPPIGLITSHPGIVERFVELLRSDDAGIQFEAAWSLTNVASGSFEQTQCVTQAGAIPVFVELLSAEHPKVRDQATWALGNIAGDSPQRRDEVLEQQVLEPLLYLLVHPDSKEETVRNVTWTISNLCRGKPQPKFELLESALPYLKNLLSLNDVDVLTDACWALSYLSDDVGPYNVKIEAVLSSGCMPLLIDKLRHQTIKVKTPALRAIGNIVTGDDGQTQRVINAGVLPRLLGLLNSARPPIRKETCWTISNITAGTKEQVHAVFRARIFEALIAILAQDRFDIQKEATWAVCNACSGGPDEVIHALVRMDVIPALVGMLDPARHHETKIVGIAIGGLQKILEKGRLLTHATPDRKNPYCELLDKEGGVRKLEDLTYCEDEEVANMATELLQSHWHVENVDEIDDDDAGPAINNETNTFSFQNPSAQAQPHLFHQNPQQQQQPTPFSFAPFNANHQQPGGEGYHDPFGGAPQ